MALFPENVLGDGTLDRAVVESGRPAQWSMAHRCSCWPLGTSNPAYGCKVCGGLWGYVYDAPQDVKILVNAINLSEQQQAFGNIELGDAVASIPNYLYDVDGNPTEFPMWRKSGQFDRITLLDTFIRSHELVTRGATNVDVMRYQKPTEIHRIFVSDALNGGVKDYTIDVDYVLNDDGNIEWLGDAPETGTRYSVTYSHRPTFIVLGELPYPRSLDGVLLPKRLHLRYADRVLEGLTKG